MTRVALSSLSICCAGMLRRELPSSLSFKISHSTLFKMSNTNMLLYHYVQIGTYIHKFSVTNKIYALFLMQNDETINNTYSYLSKQKKI